MKPGRKRRRLTSSFSTRRIDKDYARNYLPPYWPQDWLAMGRKSSSKMTAPKTCRSQSKRLRFTISAATETLASGFTKKELYDNL